MITICNYCKLKEIKERAKTNGSKVYVRKARGISNFYIQGWNVFVVPEGECLDMDRDKKGNHGKQFVAWFMEIPDCCVC